MNHAINTKLKITIRRAQPEDSDVLTRIAHAAKGYWGYPQSWIEAWKADLTLAPEFIRANEVNCAIIGDEIAGLYALSFEGNRAELEHMWVLPDFIGQGVGRELFEHALNRAALKEAVAIDISSDPNAAEFYTKMGARQVGSVSSEIEGQPRRLPRMVIEIKSE